MNRPASPRVAGGAVGPRRRRDRAGRPRAGEELGRSPQSAARARDASAVSPRQPVITWAMYAMLIAAWRAMLVSWGQRLDPWTAARIWIVSNLGKYIPGKVWALAGMTVMSQRAGVAPWAAAASAVVLQAVGIGTGAAVVGAAGAVALEAARPGSRAALQLLMVGSAVAVGLMLWPPVARRLLRLAGSGGRGRPPAGRLRRTAGHRHRHRGLARVRRGTGLPGARDTSRGSPGSGHCHRRLHGFVSCRPAGADRAGRHRRARGCDDSPAPGPARLRAPPRCWRWRRASCSPSPSSARPCRFSSPPTGVRVSSTDHPAESWQPSRPLDPGAGRVRARDADALLAHAHRPVSPGRRPVRRAATASARGARSTSGSTDGFRNGTPTSSAACRSSPPSTATCSIPPRGSAGYCRWTRR